MRVKVRLLGFGIAAAGWTPRARRRRAARALRGLPGADGKGGGERAAGSSPAPPAADGGDASSVAASAASALFAGHGEAAGTPARWRWTSCAARVCPPSTARRQPVAVPEDPVRLGRRSCWAGRTRSRSRTQHKAHARPRVGGALHVPLQALGGRRARSGPRRPVGAHARRRPDVRRRPAQIAHGRARVAATRRATILWSRRSRCAAGRRRRAGRGQIELAGGSPGFTRRSERRTRGRAGTDPRRRGTRGGRGTR